MPRYDFQRVSFTINVLSIISSSVTRKSSGIDGEKRRRESAKKCFWHLGRTFRGGTVQTYTCHGEFKKIQISPAAYCATSPCGRTSILRTYHSMTISSCFPAFADATTPVHSLSRSCGSLIMPKDLVKTWLRRILQPPYC